VGTALEVRILGPVAAVRGDRQLDVGGPRQQALLALLAVRTGAIVSADELADQLWDGDPPDGSAVSLRTYVSRLRRSLGDEATIVARDGGYALGPGIRVDAADAEARIRDARGMLAAGRARAARGRLREALERWHGDPFGERAYLPALDGDRARLEQLHLQAIELRVQADLDLGESTSLLDELERLLRDHPYQEHLWAQLMLALYRAGRQADALATYQRARRVLDAELGIDPGPELQSLEAQILRQEVAPAAVTTERSNLPHGISSFVGRERELAEVRDLVATHRLVTLTGVGGTGKTRLAIEAARGLAGRDGTSVTFVDLAQLQDGAEVAWHVARELGVSQSAGTSAVTAISDRLRADDRLLLLDNCEHVAADVTSIATAILSACPDIRILTTSREVLGVAGEATYSVQPLGTADGGEAVELFLARAKEANAILRPGTEDRQRVDQICRILDGLPLAIELAAARTKALTLEEIAARLDDRFRFLVSWRQLSTARHRTLREAMAWSYDLLAPDEQAFLRRTSVFLGGFTLEAAAVVCATGGEDDTLRLIERLVEASLLTVQPGTAVTRYRMLETVRQYAIDRLDDAELEATADRHVRYFLDLAEHGRAGVEVTGRLPVLRDLIVEDANLRAALQRTASNPRHVELELRMCAALWSYWWLHGQLADGWTFIERAIADADPAGGNRTVAYAEALCGASSLALRRGDLPNAVALGERAVAASSGPAAVARAGVALANALASAGDVDRPGPLYEAAAATFREAGMTWRLANALLNAADFAFMQGDLDLVERAASESLEMTRQLGDDAGIAVNLGNLAFADLARGRTDGAEARLIEALERSRGLGFAEWEAIMLDGLGAVAAARNENERAARLIGAASRIREEIGASLDSIERNVRARVVAALEERLGVDGLEAASAAGRAMGREDAIAFALADAGSA
jgi:predicted ATPase/DNA-binding SARP family transcriptional activator